MNNHRRKNLSDLNRPLPKLPSEKNKSKTQAPNTSSDIKRNSSPLIEELNKQLAGIPMWSTSSLSRQQFEELSRDFISPPTPSLSFQEREIMGCLDPVKYSPSKSINDSSALESSPMFVRSSSFQDLNPFRDENDRYTRWGDMYDIEDQETMAKAAHTMYEGAANKNRGKPAGMSQSRSEGNIQYPHRPAVDYDLENAVTTGGFPYIRYAGEEDPPLFDRGRVAYRSPSPVKPLDNIKEEEPIEEKASLKRAHSPMKQLFGERGWLGKSTSMKELPSEEYRKTGIKHWGGKLKEKMLGKTEDLSKMIPAAFNVHISPSKVPKRRPETKFPVSLTPPEQSKLYSELELMLSAAANKYLSIQKEAGRMSLDSIKSVTHQWVAKNRPQVIEFQFDLVTQRELVYQNVKTFRFYGPHSENMVSLVTMLNSWKAMAKEMSVRTFCTPDSVIKKQFHGTYKVLELLGAPMYSFVAFNQLHKETLQVLERRQAEKKAYESRKFGVEMPWSPKLGNHGGKEVENPFEGMFD